MLPLTFLALLLCISFLRTEVESHPDLSPCYEDENLTNGCSIPWGIDFPYKEFFKPACERHDVCYVCGYTHDVQRKICDNTFYKNMVYLCHKRDQENKVQHKKESTYTLSSISWLDIWKGMKGSWFVGKGMLKWLMQSSESLEHCLNGARIYRDAVRNFAMKDFREKYTEDCKMPCAEYMVNPKNNLTVA